MRNWSVVAPGVRSEKWPSLTTLSAQHRQTARVPGTCPRYPPCSYTYNTHTHLDIPIVVVFTTRLRYSHEQVANIIWTLCNSRTMDFQSEMGQCMYMYIYKGVIPASPAMTRKWSFFTARSAVPIPSTLGTWERVPPSFFL